MKILILSCNTGGGHNSAAAAIKEHFEKKGDACDIKDAISFWSPGKSKIISWGHVFIYRNMPKLFGVTYRFEENHPPKEGNTSTIYDLMKKGCDNLEKFLNSSDYEAIVCTHVFSTMVITELRRRGKCNLPAYFVATDYTCSPGVAENNVDGFLIPHKELADEFISNGVPAKKIFVTGIPVRDEFYTHISADEAKKELGLPEDKKIVLVMFGSMGCGPIKALTEELPNILPSDSHIVVICGNNHKLYNSLKKKNRDNVTVVGFTSKMPIYMDAASLIVTKPGGLSSTESAAKGLPMLFIEAVPGCETRNKDFFIARKFADTRLDEFDLAKLICFYLSHPEKLDFISRKLKNEFDFIATDEIYRIVHAKEAVLAE